MWQFLRILYYRLFSTPTILYLPKVFHTKIKSFIRITSLKHSFFVMKYNIYYSIAIQVVQNIIFNQLKCRKLKCHFTCEIHTHALTCRLIDIHIYIFLNRKIYIANTQYNAMSCMKYMWLHPYDHHKENYFNKTTI